MKTPIVRKAWEPSPEQRQAINSGALNAADLDDGANPPKKERKRRSKGEQILNPYEWQIQGAAVKQLRLTLAPGYIVHSTRAESGDVWDRMKAKQAGQLPGMPETYVFGDRRVWLLEFKDKKGPRGEEQKKRHRELMDAGFVVGLVRSYEDCERFLRAQGARFRGTGLALDFSKYFSEKSWEKSAGKGKEGTS